MAFRKGWSKVMRLFNPQFILEAIPQLLPYLNITLLIMISTVILGGLLGILIAAAMIRKNKILKALAYFFTYIIRCVPSIVLLFIIFYGLPQVVLQITGKDINSYNSAFFVLITFSILYSANFAEVCRSSYLAIDKGQREAAISMGLSEFQAFYRIVLPQCIAVGLPNFTNSLVSLMKEGALAYTIGLVDIMGKGKLIIANNYGAYAIETYIALGIIYWILTIIFERVFGMIERRLLRGKLIINSAEVEKPDRIFIKSGDNQSREEERL